MAIRAGSSTDKSPATDVAARRLVPMQVGNATVYVEQFGEPVVVESAGRVRAVAPPSPEEAFQVGSDILRECVRVIGERIEMMAEKAQPNKVVVEFSISFEVKGKASIVPIFLTGETGGKTGLKITAEWARV